MIRAEESGEVLVGRGDFVYAVRPDWPRRPAGLSWSEVAAVATDSRDRVYVFNRGDDPIAVFDRDGAFLHSWGRGVFARPHGITIGPDDALYCTDDHDHSVRKFTPDGSLLLTLGTRGTPSNTGARGTDYRTIQRVAPPFNFPTNIALSAEGDIFVSDGYGNARIHKFSANGRLLLSWGEPGSGRGQFRIPHGIAVDRHGNVFVADRENSRIQIFSPTGQYLDEWRDVARPCEIMFAPTGHLFVAELGFRAGLSMAAAPPAPEATGGRLSIFRPDGTREAEWGGGMNPTAPGDFFAPHDVWLDSHGAVYVAEVVMSGGGNRGLVPPTCHTLQKFEPVGARATRG